MDVVRPRDHPALLTVGFHPLKVDAVEERFVKAFALSKSRSKIMAGLRQFIEHLTAAGVKGDLWLDGSFLTEKIDPKDVDVVLRIDAELYNSGDAKVREAVDWVIANQKPALLCDSYALFEYPKEHPLYEEGKWWYAYWHAKWGFSREENPKGIAVVTLDNVAS